MTSRTDNGDLRVLRGAEAPVVSTNTRWMVKYRRRSNGMRLWIWDYTAWTERFDRAVRWHEEYACVVTDRPPVLIREDVTQTVVGVALGR